MGKTVLIGLCAVLALSACANEPVVKEPSANQQLAKRAERDVADGVKDPTSVKFKGVMASAKANCIMGDVLAKNSIGAYTGYHKFVWLDGAVALKPDRDALSDDVTYLNAFNDYMEKSIKCEHSLPHGEGPDREEAIPDT